MSDQKEYIPDVVVSAPLSPSARRMLTVLVLQALEHLPDRTSFAIPTRVLALAIPGGPVRQVRDHLQTLAQTTFSWSGPSGDRDWGTATLLAYAGVAHDHCNYAFSPLMAQMLANPPGRARLQLAIQRHISSGHTLGLYELCAPWIGVKRTPWWPVDQVRSALGLADSAYYAEFKHFNAKILKPAMNELADRSDLCITPQVRREGRLVTRLRFHVQPNVGFAVQGAAQSPDRALRTALMRLGLSEAVVDSLLATEGSEALLTCVVPQRPVSVSNRAARLAVIHRVVSRRTRAQRDADKQAFLAGLRDSADRTDFERFAWMSARNADAICSFWEQRAPDAFAFST